MKNNCSTDHCGDNKGYCFSKCFKIAVKIISGIAALGVLVMLLWNWLVPNLFIGAREIGYLQALGILVLSKILFGGIKCGGHGKRAKRQEAWEQLSPEEREQLKEQFKSRWSHWCSGTKKDDSKNAGKDGTPPAA